MDLSLVNGLATTFKPLYAEASVGGCLFFHGAQYRWLTGNKNHSLNSDLCHFFFAAL
jgi:hypothetical protein